MIDHKQLKLWKVKPQIGGINVQRAKAPPTKTLTLVVSFYPGKAFKRTITKRDYEHSAL